ncbi:Six-hairpin glycosidase-like protein [Lipomyces kononenkoae]
MRFFSMLITTTCALALVVDPTLGLPIDSPNVPPQKVLSNVVSSPRLNSPFAWIRKQSPFLSSYSDSSEDSDFESWLSVQSSRSFEGILANIGPDGVNVAGQNVQPGVVVASPSHDHPNYFYHWVRDGAITMLALVDEYARAGNVSVKTLIDDYVDNVRITQWTPNPSGQIGRGGLGEPKFEVDGRAFVGTWGRPQRDGPALRAITLISYARALQDRDGASIDSLRYLYDLIKPDLEYVSKFWASPGFDLWEELEGLHFFTAMVQYRALLLGKDISSEFNDDGAARWYHTQSNGLKRFLLSFWDEERGYLVETLASPRSGLDTAILLGSIHGGSESVFPIYSDSIIATLQALVADMRARYPINEQDSLDSDSLPMAVGIGRYPEDVYAGGDTDNSDDLGNPWFLCTATVAHILYGLVEHLALSNSGLTISNLTADFYLPFLSPTPDIKPDYCDFSATAMWSRSAPILRFMPRSKEAEQVISSIFNYADGFLRILRKHADEQGNMSEQFDRNTGFMRGARQLTWSFQSVLGAIEMRDRAIAAIEKRRAYFERFDF